MEAKRIDLADWEYFGEGGSSTSYINKKDGNIVLKLCNKDIPSATVLKEYLASKSFNEAGFPSPAVYDFVTDGERFGYTGQRIKGKVSFARTLSQEPDCIEDLAGRFAAMALALHRTPADITSMTDARESLLNSMGDLSYVPADVADAVRTRMQSIRKDTACLHGDMNPGNLVAFEGKDNWIGVNEFAYGAPCLDIATLHILCNYLPSQSISRLYHTDRKLLKKFFNAFKKAYFGDLWDSDEIKSRIEDASIVKFCAAAASKPEYTRILIPLVRGQRIKFLLRRGL